MKTMHAFEGVEEHAAAPRHHVPRAARDLFAEIEVRYATNRIARVVEDGAVTESDIVHLRSYNGELVGPILEARAGDTLNITLRNRLPPDPRGYNTTNLHFHGLHVSPAGNADNVMLELAPGTSFPYEVKIPHDHHPGTFWYHAHKHGAATIQLASGMAGALVIRGDIDEVPAIRAAREQILVFQQIPYVLTDVPHQPGQKAHMVESYAMFGPTFWRTEKRRFAINGMVEPTMRMRPGEVQRWRLIHAGLREGLKIKLVGRRGGEEFAIPQHQIAHDGITTGRLDTVESTEMHPGYRVDVLVRATHANGQPLEPGIYWLVDELAVPEARVLARVVVRGPRIRMRLPAPVELAGLAPLRTIGDDEITGTQTAVFHVDTTDPSKPRYLLNGKEFDHHAPPRRLTLGRAEEWVVTSQSFNHPFHIHVNPFQLELGGKLVWKDTLFVPAGQTARLRTRYERYVGTFMAHCHISEHADLGMAELVEIVPPEGGGAGHHDH